MKLYIEELEKTPEQQLIFQIDEKLKELTTSSNVTGDLIAVTNGFVVEIKGSIEVDILLECDRCLKEYQYHLIIDIDENFVKGKVIDDSKSEIELKGENFIEELGEKDEIDLTDLIYQSIILNLPNKKLCDINCEGSKEYKNLKTEKIIDPRLEVFKNIKDKLN